MCRNRSEKFPKGFITIKNRSIEIFWQDKMTIPKRTGRKTDNL